MKRGRPRSASSLVVGNVLAACLALASCAESTSVRPDPETVQPVLVGTVTRVIDGDTIDVQLETGPIRVRLHSIDAPEHDQPWGPQAKAALASRVDGQTVALETVTQDQYDRLVANVLLGTENVNAWLVQQGDAWAYRQYLDDASYCAYEGAARGSRVGLWSQPPSTWGAPWDWRAVQRGQAASRTDYSHETTANCILAMHALAPPNDHCLIKGNIGSNGRIYHVPGDASYEATRIDAAKGERWFCTESEARAAGWRPAKN